MATSLRTRWAAIGAAVAITLGGAGFPTVRAAISSGARPVYVAITPCRLIDTRTGSDNVGPRSTPLGAAETHTVSAHGANGQCTGIPGDAVSLAMNVTAVDATELTFLTIWPTGSQRPLASSLNPVPGAGPTPNAVVTELSTDGRFDIYNHAGSVNVLADIVGYYVDHDHDDRYLEQSEPIILSEAVSGWHTVPVLTPAPTRLLPVGALIEVSADGYIWLGLTAPPSVGGTTYVLSSVEYCLVRVEPNAFVDGAFLVSDASLLNGLQAVVTDATNRTAEGCHSLTPEDGGTARSYGLALILDATVAPAPNIDFSSVRTTWVPSTNGTMSEAVVDGGLGTTFDLDSGMPIDELFADPD